jgi:hypothetical protein
MALMIEAAQAEALATQALKSLVVEGDPLVKTWPGSTIGNAQRVEDVEGHAAYWIVPILFQGHVVGFVRIGATGTTDAIGVTCRRTADLPNCPTLITGLSAEEVRQRVLSSGLLDEGETVSTPRFIHDGPPGRETWMVETSIHAKPRRWLFVSRAGIYERRAGVHHGADPGME